MICAGFCLAIIKSLPCKGGFLYAQRYLKRKRDRAGDVFTAFFDKKLEAIAGRLSKKFVVNVEDIRSYIYI